MKQICEKCGLVFDESKMMSYNSGRKTHWFCWECWKAGQYDAAVVEISRKKAQKKGKLKYK